MADQEPSATEFLRLVRIIADLRGEHGCPWDREQTHASLKPCLIEEAYEVCDAIDASSPDDLRGELGDLLMQAVMHAQLAEESNQFDITDVLREISDKLIRRHPHVFGDVTATSTEEVLKRWERIKQEENDGMRSLMDGIPQSLPALMRAQKIQDKFARVGFDWPDTGGAIEKLDEESKEVAAAIQSGDSKRIEEELGDLLFAAVNVARLSGLDAEQALKATTHKVADRFRRIEKSAKEQGRDVRDMTLEEMDEIWEESKRVSE